ncbi:branched-chain amino acid ABC transporter permease [Halorubrum ezzemoulense]|uniref:Amino acid/amide ABC transporter membrane protein 1, HAAT family n=2 Tax=Halorubrum ezzemoulense TaxID=337243 RepID=A0A256IWQ4_HALEZ|nr:MULTISPECIES: branched-chain amino acid ABC transporter permease [Halorubrum]MDB2224138.1 branched-chain amino acid ABC transporter permease [Halorubrum ezzemoulense]MDB2238068.1 branched-chain amino acid ABC transporter permease [Halorubrum ezzemoulense]MDB2240338.1 branched-chain amino acid ABC transporter permease [Halorubrum ezzemoulense]MDB2243788.1 branched-chain amino acid ABC transporter permease [Halorubrum ezzemoulense]MDB2247537.1 branched-chain amino acid ABC transporter permeas
MVDWVTFIDISLSGLGLGALYALVAMGFSLIYKVTGVLNFAQGQIAMIGAYGVVVFGTATVLPAAIPAWAAVLVTVLLGLVLGLALERVVFRQFIGEPVLSVIIVTLALGSILEGVVFFLYGQNAQAYPSALTFGGQLSLPLGTSIQAAYAIAVAIALVVVAVLMLFFRETVTGSILRASASDEQAAMVLGVSIERTIALAWTLSIAITAIGGILLATSSGGAAVSIENTGIIIFAAVVLGGLDSIPGAFIGSIVVGVLQELGSYYLVGGTAVYVPFTDVQANFGAGFGEILPLILLLVVILVKPYGLFGTERIERL